VTQQGQHRQRQVLEAEFVRRNMPPDTTRFELNGADIWVFEIAPEGMQFTIGIYYDADFNAYAAQCISPRIEDRWTPARAHDFHLYADGQICLSSKTHAHMPTMAAAYGRSCLWALGVALLEQGRAMGYPETTFPF